MTHSTACTGAEPGTESTTDVATESTSDAANLRGNHAAIQPDTHLGTPGTLGARDTEHRLIALIESELVLPAQTVHAGTPIAHLGDSLDWLELMMAVEEAFGVQLDPVQTKSIRTVADLLRLLPQAGDRLHDDLQASVQRSLATMSAPQPF